MCVSAGRGCLAALTPGHGPLTLEPPLPARAVLCPSGEAPRAPEIPCIRVSAAPADSGFPSPPFHPQPPWITVFLLRPLSRVSSCGCARPLLLTAAVVGRRWAHRSTACFRLRLRPALSLSHLPSLGDASPPPHSMVIRTLAFQLYLARLLLEAIAHHLQPEWRPLPSGETPAPVCARPPQVRLC